MVDYKVLRRDIWSGGIKLDALEGFDQDFLLGGGSAVAESYPKKGAVYSVDKSPVTRPGPERPGKAGKTKPSTFLTDALDNTDNTLVVSERLRAILAKAEKHVEFLPVTIKGYKERYFIANLLDHVACLDETKSKLKKSTRADKIMKIERLAIRADAVPKTRSIFRVKEYPDLVLVRAKLAMSLAEANLTGIDLVEISDYTG